ncbi:ribonuclease Z [Lutibacter sp. TH_r2]|uniref:ribonuclease Z n=1 Tax=Lutibacter sp. TH_r2 TaxID=3082083 RepID=UPI0029550750|nr:ribonuclease Z [Lutibacter sp. TH_r2]MDV7187170.1 ribonuclease Z [Lutibacter sp. TH_r2]
MNISKNKKYTLVKIENTNISNFLKDFTNNFTNFKGEQLIVDFSENSNTTEKDLILFLKLNNQHKEDGTSFVIICETVDIDNLPEELNVVPTLTEAEDIIEMEAIERDLGF